MHSVLYHRYMGNAMGIATIAPVLLPCQVLCEHGRTGSAPVSTPDVFGFTSLSTSPRYQPRGRKIPKHQYRGNIPMSGELQPSARP